MMQISELYGCFHTSAALLVFVILLAFLFVLVATLLIVNRNERKTTEQHKRDIKKLLNE